MFIFAVVKPCFIIIINISLKNQLYILFIDLFSDLYKLCCDEETATKTEKISLRIPNQISMYTF